MSYSIDEQVSMLRACVQMGHTPGTNHTKNTSFSTYPVDCMTHMRYDDVLKIVDELEKAAMCNGSLDTTQRYMYWHLKDNGIIDALNNLRTIMETEDE